MATPRRKYRGAIGARTSVPCSPLAAHRSGRRLRSVSAAWAAASTIIASVAFAPTTPDAASVSVALVPPSVAVARAMERGGVDLAVRGYGSHGRGALRRAHAALVRCWGAEGAAGAAGARPDMADGVDSDGHAAAKLPLDTGVYVVQHDYQTHGLRLKWR